MKTKYLISYRFERKRQKDREKEKDIEREQQKGRRMQTDGDTNLKIV